MCTPVNWRSIHLPPTHTPPTHPPTTMRKQRAQEQGPVPVVSRPANASTKLSSDACADLNWRLPVVTDDHMRCGRRQSVRCWRSAPAITLFDGAGVLPGRVAMPVASCRSASPPAYKPGCSSDQRLVCSLGQLCVPLYRGLPWCILTN
jgi:hypothetical protein